MSYAFLISLVLGLASCMKETAPVAADGAGPCADLVITTDQGRTKVTEAGSANLIADGFRVCTWDVWSNKEHIAPVKVTSSSGEFPTGRQWPSLTKPVKAYAVYPASLTLKNGASYATVDVGSASAPYDHATDILYSCITRPYSATVNGRLPLTFGHATQYVYGLKLKLDTPGTQFKARITRLRIETRKYSSAYIGYGASGATVSWVYSWSSDASARTLLDIIPTSSPTSWFTGTSWTDLSASVNKTFLLPFSGSGAHSCIINYEICCGNETKSYSYSKNIDLPIGSKSTIEATIAVKSGSVSLSITEEPWADGGVTDYTY